MSGRVRIAAALIAMILVAVPIQAQDRVEQVIPLSRVREMLASADSKEAAWGAWLAGQLRVVDTAPALEQVVRQHIGRSQFPETLVAGQALDALIQLDARPDPVLVAAAHEHYPEEAVILLARLGHLGHPALLAIMEKAVGLEWRAVAGTLYAAKAPGLAVRLLHGVVLTARTVVSLEGNQGVGEGIGMGVAIADFAGGVTPGYPPSVSYAFRACDTPGVVVLVHRPFPACYQRHVSPAGVYYPLPEHINSGPTVRDRLTYFLPRSEGLWDQSLHVRWSNEAALKAARAEFLERIRAKWQALIQGLVAEQWLSAEEAKRLSTPEINEVLIDRRPR